jgi:hypothetical protein
MILNTKPAVSARPPRHEEARAETKRIHSTVGADFREHAGRKMRVDAAKANSEKALS